MLEEGLTTGKVTWGLSSTLETFAKQSQAMLLLCAVTIKVFLTISLFKLYSNIDSHSDSSLIVTYTLQYSEMLMPQVAKNVVKNKTKQNKEHRHTWRLHTCKDSIHTCKTLDLEVKSLSNQYSDGLGKEAILKTCCVGGNAPVAVYQRGVTRTGWAGWLTSLMMDSALLLQRTGSMFCSRGRSTPIILDSDRIVLVNSLRSWADILPSHTVMQPVRILSMVHLEIQSFWVSSERTVSAGLS